MKKKKILIPLSLMTLLIAGLGISQAMAAGNSSSTNMFGRGRGQQKERPVSLTDEQKAAMQTKIDAVKAAETAGDYEAWAIAIKAMNENSPLLKKVTSADQFKTYLKDQKERETQMAARQTQMDTVNAALAKGDYNAWATAVKAMDSDCAILEKINADNFSKYAEAYKLRNQADAILKNLNIENEGRSGFGSGGMGGHRGGGMGMFRGMDKPDDTNNNK